MWMETARWRRTSANERRGLAGDRPGRKFCGARGCSCDSFAFPADASVPAIFKNYTTIGEFLADAIRGGEVAALTGGVAVGDAFFNFGVAERLGVLAVAQRAEFGGVIIFEDGEHAVEICEELFGGGDVLLAEFALVDGDVGFANEIVSRGEGLRGVEVVGKASVEIGVGFGDAFGHAGTSAGSEFPLRKAIGKIAKALDGAGGLLEAVEREIKLAAIGNTGEGKAQSRGLIALGKKIAEGEEIAEGLGHFLAFDEKMLGVEPVADEGFAGGGFALRDFVFVVRER